VATTNLLPVPVAPHLNLLVELLNLELLTRRNNNEKNNRVLNPSTICNLPFDDSLPEGPFYIIDIVFD
jgi:hypothetical protein